MDALHITNKQNKKNSQLKQKIVAFGALIGLFIVAVQLDVLSSPFSIIRPSHEVPQYDAFSEVVPKLYTIKNSYRLQKDSSFIPQAQAADPSIDELAAYGVIDLETGSVIFEKNLDKKLPIASLTKLMTSIVALDLMDPSERVKITQHAADQIPTKIGVVAGEHMTIDELLRATMLTSANDAAQAVHDGVDAKYGDQVFIRAMNEKAKFIGLKNTHFDNPQGFDGDNYSTIEDYAILSHYALTHYPLIAKIVALDSDYLPADEYHKQFDLPNWNGLIGVYPNTSGIKIGNTELAHKTTAVVSERSGKKILVVSLGAPDVLSRDMFAAELLDLGFEELLGLEPVEVTEEQLRDKYATWNY